MEYDTDYTESFEADNAEFDYSYSEQAGDVSSSYTIQELWNYCLMPTISDGVSASKFLLSFCIVFRLTLSLSQGKIPAVWCHLVLGSGGIVCLYHFFGAQTFFVVVLALLGSAALWLAHTTIGKYRGFSCAAVCVVYLVSCELFIVDKKQWHKIRGSQMVLTMKLISLAYDIDVEGQHLPGLFECFGYLFCVGNVIFGPWVNFASYVGLQDSSVMNISWLLKIGKSLFISFLYLTISTCWTNWVLSDNSWMWIVVYRDALAFRSSHYFVCYLAETSSSLLGISSAASKGSSPVHIEVPRSLVEVVIYWNMPMHSWLKKYVFKNAKRYGTFPAIILTYAASALLHGLNFQLAAVLLSLGFYTYIEFVLRKKLASTFDACVAARKCPTECQHRNKKSHPCVTATNVGFGLLSVFHLSYLGVMFDSSSALQEEGYSMQHALSKWSDLNFASHWVALATFVFNALI